MNLRPKEEVPRAKIGTQQSGLEDPHKILEDFFGTFDGVKLKNSEGKIIILKVGKEYETSDKKSCHWILEFEGHSTDYRRGNYIKLTTNPVERNILIGRAQLTDEDLKGKNIYPQIIKLMGEKFPNGFNLEATIGSPKEHRVATKLFEDFEAGNIGENILKQKLFEMIRFLQLRRDAGFNTFKITHVATYEVNVKCSKDTSQRDSLLRIEVQPLKKNAQR